MIETLELRSKPELKVILNKDEFEIADESEPHNNGIYSVEKLRKVKLNEERINWFISALSLVVDLFSGSAVGGRFKKKACLNFEMENENLRIWLIGVDLQKAKRVSELLNDKSK